MKLGNTQTFITTTLRNLLLFYRNPLNGILNNIDILNSNAERAKEILHAQSDNLLNCDELLERTLVDLDCLDAIKQCAEHQRVITDDVSLSYFFYLFIL